ncbi:NADP-dependent alcohol dehydrogenase [Colletotrichum navitas]|uniref:NADP-dependent alcohol dehydrogenase n=1 Tax=Colletotrichum navitas TaxID=681940 RepID=A0AAD8V0H5_9PEZI|nr:NADP-dependent alcohol dehydrogenase [Colletotrichum navitas]KAK1574782.1 NADP-dependent alcohol dehydrogenase [Colletotrichum navitas]
MGIDFTVFKGSPSGDIVQATGHRDPGPTEVIIKISHCGVRFTDEHYRHADKGLGHEGVGTIIEVGSAVHETSDFRVGDRVGMGWYYKFCGHCRACLTGRQTQCAAKASFANSNADQGGFGTAVAWDVSALFKLPENLGSEYAGPLMCSGATVWRPLYDSGAKAGDRVGVIGVGGLGHLAIQFASKMGMEVVVFSSTESKKQDALEFGASEFHVTTGVTKFDGIAKLDFLLLTANDVPDISIYLPILASGAQLFPLTASSKTLPLSPFSFISGELRVIGCNVAPPASLRAMLEFAAKHDIKPQIEKFPLTQAGITSAMVKLRNGKMRYRGVLVA